MGGLQTLEWALLDPERVESIAVIAASARHSAWCLAWSEAQRLALRADPKFRDGAYPRDDAPAAGLGAARAIAMATYRSALALNERYDREDGAAVFGARARLPQDFAARAWMRHHAEHFVARFDANCYLALIDAMDRHDVGHERGGTEAALARIAQPALVVSISSDMLYPLADQQALYDGLPNASLVEIPSANGHDGFLLDAARMELSLREFRERNRASAAEVASYVA
jgi:homoserine O-acetyltransferase